jgi:hypothetical protein
MASARDHQRLSYVLRMELLRGSSQRSAATNVSLVRPLADTGLFEAINHLLVIADRERVGRKASPSAAVIDSQSINTTESDGTLRGRASARAARPSHMRDRNLKALTGIPHDGLARATALHQVA